MIEIKNATCAYSYGEAFEVKDAVFQNGFISSVIGKNGSGKSTFIRMLAGGMHYKGSILVDGKECREYTSMERAKKTAFLPQSLKSVSMDVKTLVEHGRYPYHGNFRRMTAKDREATDRALELTGMAEYANRELKELSGGERQRAYLAMVIAQDSSVILMDEPTTYMDLLHQENFYSVLKLLAKEGKGIIMVCHDLEQSFAYSDMIYVMEERKLVYSGTPLELSREENLLRRNFGIVMKKTKEEDALYPFAKRK